MVKSSVHGSKWSSYPNSAFSFVLWSFCSTWAPFLRPRYQSTRLLQHLQIGIKLKAHWQLDFLMFLDSTIWLFRCYAGLLFLGF